MTLDETNRLLTRLAQSEDPWVERKETFNEREVRKTLVGFANSIREGEAAVLFLGARNDGRHPGLKDADGDQKKVAGVATGKCYPPIAYQAAVIHVNVDGQSKEILAIIVPFSANRPHFGGIAHIRRGSETIEASRDVFLELITSQNDKARRILQFKDKKVWLRLQSKSGFWYDLECTVCSCDAHSVTVRDNESYNWSFPIPNIEIQRTPMRALEIIATPTGTEEEHIRVMVRRWARIRKPPALGEFTLPSDWLLSQFLANPASAMPSVAAEADGTSDPWLKLLLVHLRFALKKTKDPLTREQKLRRLHELHQGVLGKMSQRGMIHSGPCFVAEVEAVAEFATSVSEAKEFLEIVISRNQPKVQNEQRRWLLEKLGLSATVTA